MPSIFRSLFLVLFCVLLNACTAIKLTYNNADSLIYWWLDGYADFNLDQKPRVQDELLALQQWHRQTQLTTYADFIARLQPSAASNITGAQMCTHWAWVTNQLPPITQYLEPKVLWLASQLDATQLLEVQKKFDKTNKDWRKEWMPDSKEELIKNTYKTHRDRLDNLYGRISDEQEMMLKKLIAESPFDSKIAYTERLRRQQDILIALKEIQTKKPSPESANAILRAVLQRSLVSTNIEYRQYSDRLRIAYCDLYAKFHNSVSNSQRTKLQEKLKEYERDLRTLSQQKPSSQK
jgi:hypothetical protein